MKLTGVRLVGEDFASLKAAAELASRAPVVGYGATGLRTLSQMAWDDANKLAQELAVKNGLPDGSFFYSVTNDGEFLVPDGYEAEYDNLRARVA